MAAPLQSLIDTALGLLFPDRCAGCRRTGSLFCAACQARLQPYPDQGRLQAIHGTDGTPLLDQVTIAFLFEGPLREAIHELKYKRVRRMAAPLAALLAHRLRSHPLPTDALLPVPLHARRLAERGFNQSALLAHHLAEQHGLPLLHDGLVRSRNTTHQVGLAANERQANVQGAFVWQAQRPPPPRVLLIDDVVTTGATLGACAQALRAAGSREVRALVLARSRLDARL